MTTRQNPLITIFVPTLNGGGAERVAVILANGIAKRGFPVHLVIAKNKGVYFHEISEKVTLFSLNAKRTIFSLGAWWSYLRSYHPSVVLSVLENANLVAIWTRLFSKLPAQLVISEHSVNSLLYSHHSRWDLRLIPFLSRIFYRYADRIIAVSDGVAKDLINKRCQLKKFVSFITLSISLRLSN